MEPILAWRTWRIKKGLLFGFWGTSWDTSSLLATCEHSNEDVPHQGGRCGIYAVKSHSQVKPYLNFKDVRKIERNIFIFCAALGLSPFILRFLLELLHPDWIEVASRIFAVVALILILLVAARIDGDWFTSVDYGYEGKILGIVALKGKILAYNESSVMRAQKGEIVCFVADKSFNKKILTEIKNNYSLPVFNDWQSAEKYAGEFGQFQT